MMSKTETSKGEFLSHCFTNTQRTSPRQLNSSPESNHVGRRFRSLIEFLVPVLLRFWNGCRNLSAKSVCRMQFSPSFLKILLICSKNMCMVLFCQHQRRDFTEQMHVLTIKSQVGTNLYTLAKDDVITKTAPDEL
jgi:hypothetical protein